MIRLDTYSQLIHQLATWRHQQRIPQSAIARTLGVAAPAISNWENGYRICAGDHLIDWIHAGNIDIYLARRPLAALEKFDQSR